MGYMGYHVSSLLFQFDLLLFLSSFHSFLLSHLNLLLSLCDNNVLQNVPVDQHFYHTCLDLFQKNPVGEGKQGLGSEWCARLPTDRSSSLTGT